MMTALQKFGCHSLTRPTCGTDNRYIHGADTGVSEATPAESTTWATPQRNTVARVLTVSNSASSRKRSISNLTSGTLRTELPLKVVLGGTERIADLFFGKRGSDDIESTSRRDSRPPSVINSSPWPRQLDQFLRSPKLCRRRAVLGGELCFQYF